MKTKNAAANGTVKPLSVGEIAAYSMGSLGREFSNNCVNAFFLVYLCIYQGLNPVIMTVAFVLAKLWDAINDPMLATIVNNTKRSRFGRYRPWMLGGAIVNAITLFCMFIPLGEGTSEIWRYTFYISMYVLWGMSFTVLDVPFWSMLPTIANSTQERNRASSMAKLIGGFGGFLVGMTGTSFILPKFSKYGMNKAYMIIGMVSGLILIIFMLVSVIVNREKYPIPHSDVGLKTIFKIFKNNDQLRAYALSLLFYQTGYSLAISQILYLYIYCYENGANFLSSSYSYTLFWVIACTGQGIAMFFYDLITKKIPREKLYQFSFSSCIVSYVLMFFVFFILKEGNYLLNSVLVALSGAFLMTSAGINQIGSTVMIADITDYEEYKTGERADTLMFSVQTLILKFSGTVAMFVLGIGITVAGLPTISELPVTNQDGTYSHSVNVFTDDSGQYLVSDRDVYDVLKADEKYSDKVELSDSILISEKSLTVLRVFMFLAPIPMCVAALLIYKKKYTLYGEEYDEIKRQIDKRRLEKDSEQLFEKEI